MALEDIIDSLKNYRSRTKIAIDQYVDPSLFWLASNAAYLYTSDNLLDFVSERVDNNEGAAMLITYATLAASCFYLNKYLITPLSKKINNFHKKRLKRRSTAGLQSWFRSLGQIGSMFALYYTTNFPATINNFKYDAERIVDAFAREETQIVQIIEDEQTRDITPPSLEPEVPQTLDLRKVRESNIFSTRGRFLRTLRWDKTITQKENKYGLEPGILAGLIMRESFGNPLALNFGADGGAGLMMFQPGTARAYNLKVYGESRAVGRDRNHGRKLAELVRRTHYNYETLSSIDQRFDVDKSTDAAARYLKNLHRKHSSWDRALSAYNRGTPARNPKQTAHVKMTRVYQRYYLDNKQRFGFTVDTETLSRLNRENGLDFDFVRLNSRHQSVFSHTVVSGDNSTLIADNFNRWDRQRNDLFAEVDYADVVDIKGNYVGSLIQPGQKVYILTKRK